jgi:DNA-directed RNA polymerase sigma subunit (sigma70/sigma32)
MAALDDRSTQLLAARYGNRSENSQQTLRAIGGRPGATSAVVTAGAGAVRDGARDIA